MKSLKIGQFVFPAWAIALILISCIGGALGYYLWRTLTVPIEVKEPIEILQYPSQLSLFPGERLDFNVTVLNHASINYSVVLNFTLSNTTYQESFVTFSSEMYTVVPSQQNLTAWVEVDASAPPMNLTLSIDFMRGVYPSGLVGYWKFDEGKGGIVFDKSGNDNNGLLIGNHTWIAGKFGKALWLHEEGSYVIVPDSSSLDFRGVHPFALTAWIKPDSPQGQTSLAANIIDKYSNYGLIYDHGNPDARGVVFRSGGSWHYSGEVEISTGVWHNYVGVYDPPYLIAYLDGNKVAEREVGLLNLDDNSNNVVFGTNMELTSQYFGAIDEVSIYNRALSAEEVTALYTSPPF